MGSHDDSFNNLDFQRRFDEPLVLSAHTSAPTSGNIRAVTRCISGGIGWKLNESNPRDGLSVSYAGKPIVLRKNSNAPETVMAVQQHAPIAMRQFVTNVNVVKQGQPLTNPLLRLQDDRSVMKQDSKTGRARR